jgi:hypothetical protein
VSSGLEEHLFSLFFFTLYAWPCKVIIAVYVFVSRWWRSPNIFNDAAVARFSVFKPHPYQCHLVMLPITARLVIRDRVDSDSREFSYYSLTYMHAFVGCVFWLGCVLAHRCVDVSIIIIYLNLYFKMLKKLK